MLIGIDGNEANIEKKVGVGRYAFELLKQFYTYHLSPITYHIYLKDEPLPDLPSKNDWWQYKVVGPRKFWTQIGLPMVLIKERLFGKSPDVFFTPSHYAPRFSPCPTVISIMDLSYLYFPEMFRKQDLYQLKNWTAYSVRKACRILTISRSTKRDIMKYYQVPEERVVVTYPGGDEVSSIKYQVLSMKDIREKYGIKGDYILSVGTLQPRKNFVRLIQTLNILISQYPNISLVIVGKPGWLFEEIYQAPKKFGVEKKVKFLNYVPDEDLPGLYKGATCFVLVSLYEGFGIPILEAMSNGCPVVASNISSLPEVVGKAGILVDPYNIEDIAQGIKKAIKNRKALIKKGVVQCQQFSWEKCAKETLEVLKNVVFRKY
jgi:glycosyltransferase involved in cell wall biosynthesis